MFQQNLGLEDLLSLIHNNRKELDSLREAADSLSVSDDSFFDDLSVLVSVYDLLKHDSQELKATLLWTDINFLNFYQQLLAVFSQQDRSSKKNRQVGVDPSHQGWDFRGEDYQQGAAPPPPPRPPVPTARVATVLSPTPLQPKRLVFTQLLVPNFSLRRSKVLARPPTPPLETHPLFGQQSPSQSQQPPEKSAVKPEPKLQKTELDELVRGIENLLDHYNGAVVIQCARILELPCADLVNMLECCVSLGFNESGGYLRSTIRAMNQERREVLRQSLAHLTALMRDIEKVENNDTTPPIVEMDHVESNDSGPPCF